MNKQGYGRAWGIDRMKRYEYYTCEKIEIENAFVVKDKNGVEIARAPTKKQAWRAAYLVCFPPLTPEKKKKYNEWRKERLAYREEQRIRELKYEQFWSYVYYGVIKDDEFSSGDRKNKSLRRYYRRRNDRSCR